MINIIFIAGLVIFTFSSLYFYLTKRKQNSLNTAFLVSFVTLASFTLMWQGSFVSESAGGQPIYWTRWLFYAISCSLLMLEIARTKGISSAGKIAELIFLNVLVMGTGVLAAISTGLYKWIFFGLSAIAYIVQISPILKIRSKESNWVNTVIFLGWTGFPIVFLLAPTGFGIINTFTAMILYLILDIYTKIIFNMQLKS